MKKFLFVKVFVVFLALFGFSYGVSAQDEAFSKGDKVVQLGIGIGSYIDWAGYSTKFPLISGSFEFGILDLLNDKAAIGVGGYLAYTSFGYKGDSNWSISDLIVGPRAAFHYQFMEKLDTYAGLMIGYDVVSYGQKDANLSGSGFTSSWYIGARYYFTSSIAIFGELGYGIAPLELGISYKFY